MSGPYDAWSLFGPLLRSTEGIPMSEPRRPWIWDLLRLKKRPALDKLENDLVRGLKPEYRKFAGDPQQPAHQQLPLKKR